MMNAKKVRGRYAPSPTGPLHLGNVRTALIAWLQVRLSDGVFVMRMEDLDRPRTVEGSAAQILDDLAWLGLDWDEGPFVQSERDDRYAAALKTLVDAGRVFPCWCSRRDIAEASSAPHEGSPRYPGTCRELTPQEIRDVQDRKPDREPAWRYRVSEGGITVQDEILGPFTQDLQNDVGDFVLRRTDGLYAYQLAVVVDDIEMGITDVVRGADLLDSTPRQIALYRALGATPPRFWHVPLMTDQHGERMSKRHGAESLHELRETGWSAERIIGRLASTLGWCGEDEALSARELQERLAGKELASLL